MSRFISINSIVLLKYIGKANYCWIGTFIFFWLKITIEQVFEMNIYIGYDVH